LLAFFRGVVRELIAVVAWVLGFVGAIAFTPALGTMLPAIPGYPGVPYLIAFALIVIGALLLGALIAWPLTKAVRAAGLGFVDRFLGSIFGLVRGLALVLAFVIVAGLTPLPHTAWWERSALVPPLVAGVSISGALVVLAISTGCSSSNEPEHPRDDSDQLPHDAAEECEQRRQADDQQHGPVERRHRSRATPSSNSDSSASRTNVLHVDMNDCFHHGPMPATRGRSEAT